MGRQGAVVDVRVQALERGLTDAAELDDLAATWRRWGTSDRGWPTILHGEVVCRG